MAKADVRRDTKDGHGDEMGYRVTYDTYMTASQYIIAYDEQNSPPWI